MLADQFNQAAAGARTFPQLEEISRLLWRAHGEGQIPDAAAEAIAEAVQARRVALASSKSRVASEAAYTRRRAVPRSPDRQASLERRRRVAMSGVVPGKIAAAFTPGELAVLSIIGRQCQRAGVCTLPIDAIAALAGVSRTTVQNAQRQARALGLIEVRERRRRGLPSLPNVVSVTDKLWRAWLKLSGQGGGFKKLSPTFNNFHSIVKSGDKPAKKHNTLWRNGASSCYVQKIQKGGGAKLF